MRLELQLGLESMDPGFSSASTGRRRRTGRDDLLRPGARATRGSKGPRVNTVASADEQALGCSVPRRGRTRGTGGPAAGVNTWQTSRVLQLVLLEDEDEPASLGAGPSSELLLQLLSQQHGADGAAAVRPAPGIPAGMPLGGIAPGLLQGGGFAAGALLQALAAPGLGLVAQQ
ncbi:hypothetical protein OEZ86_000123 [Tetradesmus obliquus]|nr:hypothetical protein OEZ86_000123 [Tetradesmus obliquus]